MDSIWRVWERIGLQLKLQIMIQGFLIVILLCAQYWIYTQLEHQVMSAAQERTVAIADGAINGLNTLMVTKLGSQDVISDTTARATFIQRMGCLRQSQGVAHHPWQRNQRRIWPRRAAGASN